VDAQGALISYLLVQPDKYGEHDVLSVVDHHTMHSGETELLALIRHVITHPERFAGGTKPSILMLNFLGEPVLKMKPPGVFVRENLGKHYYSLPKSIANAPKRCVLAEGDFGC
jgi:hypothetical protein